jgi:hypothetical protein
MAISKAQAATIQQYTETILPSGEMHVVGNFDGNDVKQTLPNRVPGMLFYDPSNNNLFLVQHVNETFPHWKYVSFVHEISKEISKEDTK